MLGSKVNRLMSDLTLHTGFQGSSNTICVDWFNHNGVRIQNKVELRILPRDKPRTLEILIDGHVVATVIGYDKSETVWGNPATIEQPTANGANESE